MDNDESIEAAGPEQEAQPSIDHDRLREALGLTMRNKFTRYERDRHHAEQKWLRNLRQFLGKYDPEVLSTLTPEMSKAYPRLTRVKCVSMLSRMINMLFPASERNWTLMPSPVPRVDPEVMMQLVQELQAELAPPPSEDPAAPPPAPPQITEELVDAKVMEYVTVRAKRMGDHVDDQLSELGGSALIDYVSLCTKVLMSGIMYGVGILKGPYTRETYQRKLDMSQMPPVVMREEVYRPYFEFVPVWDWYPDMSAKNFAGMDGQFFRFVMSQSQANELADREDFYGDIIRQYIKDTPDGNYRDRTFDSELRSMGVASNVNANTTGKYEFIVWEGQVTARCLSIAGIKVPEDQMHRTFKSCVWLLDDRVVKVDMDPWENLLIEQGYYMKVNTVHVFSFEEDDTSLINNGIPDIMRDSQLGIAASARMLLDNASVATGQNLEINLALLKADQDLTRIAPRKLWYRDDDNPATANAPAVRSVQIDSHIAELKEMIALFREFADTETFISPATGGDLQKGPSEPFRTAAGASMLRGDMALPFKQAVRNFDSFTVSVINSLVAFNLVFNPDSSIKGDYNVIARGATSLVAKEIRAMQLDELKASLDPEERLYVDAKQLLLERVSARDLDIRSILVSDAEAERRRQSQSQAQAAQQQALQELMRAEVRKTLADAVKAITQAQKNTASAEAAKINAFLDALEKGIEIGNIARGETGGVETGGGEQATARGPSALQVVNNPRGALQ